MLERPAGYQLPSCSLISGHMRPQEMMAPNRMLQDTIWGHSMPTPT